MTNQTRKPAVEQALHQVLATLLENPTAMPSFLECALDTHGATEEGGTARKPKRAFGTSAAASAADDSERHKIDLINAVASFEALKRTRMHDAMLCDFVKAPKSNHGMAVAEETTKWIEATAANPQSHNLGPLFPYAYRPLVLGASQAIDASPELETKIGEEGCTFLRKHIAAIKATEDVHELCTHCSGKVSYSDQFIVIEACFAPTVEAQAVRKIVKAVLKHNGAEVCVGPPPASTAEREVKQLIKELREKLGIKPAGRGRRA